MRIKLLAAVYVGLLLAIIVLANHEETRFIFTAVRALPGGDRMGHFLLMGMLSFVVNLALSARRVRVLGANVLLGGAVVAVAVTIEEFSQLLVRGRTFDLVDLACNYAGIVVFGAVAARLVRPSGASST